MCLCVCVSVCPCVVTLTIAFLCGFSPNLTQRCKPSKVRTSSLGVNIAPPLPLFYPYKSPFWRRGPKNLCKYEERNIYSKCSSQWRPRDLMFIRLDRVPACDRQTDGQTDGNAVGITALCIASNAAALNWRLQRKRQSRVQKHCSKFSLQYVQQFGF